MVPQDIRMITWKHHEIIQQGHIDQMRKQMQAEYQKKLDAIKADAQKAVQKVLDANLTVVRRRSDGVFGRRYAFTIEFDANLFAYMFCGDSRHEEGVIAQMVGDDVRGRILSHRFVEI